MSGLTVVRAALAFVATLVFTRQLGPAGRGEVALVVGVTALLSLVGAAGLTPAVAAGVPGRRAVLGVAVLRAVVVVGAGAAVVPLLPDAVLPGVGAMAAIAVAVPCAVVTTAAVAHASALGRAVPAATAGLIGPAGFAVALLVLGRTSPLIVSWLWVLSAAVTAVAVVAAGGRAPTGEVGGRVLMARSLAANPGELALFALWRADVLVVHVLRGPAELGRYAVAVSLAEVLMLVVYGLRMALLPTGRGGALAIARGIRVALAVGSVAALSLGLSAPIVVPMLFGSAYAEAALALAVLAPGALLLGLAFPLADALAAVGRSAAVARAAGLALVANLAANIVLLPAHSFLVAAVAATGAYAVAFGGLVVAFAQATGQPVRAVVVVRRRDLGVVRGAQCR